MTSNIFFLVSNKMTSNVVGQSYQAIKSAMYTIVNWAGIYTEDPGMSIVAFVECLSLNFLMD